MHTSLSIWQNARMKHDNQNKQTNKQTKNLIIIIRRSKTWMGFRVCDTIFSVNQPRKMMRAGLWIRWQIWDHSLRASHTMETGGREFVNQVSFGTTVFSDNHPMETTDTSLWTSHNYDSFGTTVFRDNHPMETTDTGLWFKTALGSQSSAKTTRW